MNNNFKTIKARGDAAANAFAMAIAGINRMLENERRRERRKTLNQNQIKANFFKWSIAWRTRPEYQDNFNTYSRRKRIKYIKRFLRLAWWVDLDLEVLSVAFNSEFWKSYSDESFFKNALNGCIEKAKIIEAYIKYVENHRIFKSK